MDNGEPIEPIRKGRSYRHDDKTIHMEEKENVIMNEKQKVYFNVNNWVERYYFQNSVYPTNELIGAVVKYHNTPVYITDFAFNYKVECFIEPLNKLESYELRRCCITRAEPLNPGYASLKNRKQVFISTCPINFALCKNEFTTDDSLLSEYLMLQYGNGFEFRLEKSFVVDNVFYCVKCGKYHPTNKRVRNTKLKRGTHDGVSKGICLKCMMETHEKCVCCGDWIPKEKPNQHIDTGMGCLCNKCRKNNIHRVDFRKGYGHTQVSHKFSTDGEVNSKYFGIELEMYAGDNRLMAQIETLQSLNKYPHQFVELKYDGSVGDDGFEMVTQPATRKFHEKAGYDKLLDVLRNEYDVTSQDAPNSCGLHIHVSRDAFISSFDVFAKCTWFMNLNYHDVLKFSRRNEDDMEEWAKILELDYYDACDREFMRNVDDSRYLSVNNQNAHTIEFRLFCGTMKPTTFMVSLEFVDVLTEYADTHTWEEMRNCNFHTLAENSSKEFRKYCADRKLGGF